MPGRRHFPLAHARIKILVVNRPDPSSARRLAWTVGVASIMLLLGALALMEDVLPAPSPQGAVGSKFGHFIPSG